MTLGKPFGSGFQGGHFNEVLRLLLMSEQRFDFPAQFLVARTGFFQERGLLALLTLQRGVIDLLNCRQRSGVIETTCMQATRSGQGL